MGYHDNKKDRDKRRRKLIENSFCDCGRKAQFPWRGKNFCDKCFVKLMEEEAKWTRNLKMQTGGD